MTEKKGYALVLADFNNAAEGHKRVKEAVEIWGAKIVRISLYPRDVESNKAAFRASLETCLRAFGGAVAAAQEKNIQLVLCVHNFWGNEDKGPGNAEGRFHKRRYRKEFFRMWRVITERYIDEPAIHSFEIANEPEPGVGREETWNSMSGRICRMIREIDSDRVLIVPAVRADPRDISHLKTVKTTEFGNTPMPLVFYCIHVYNQMSITHPWTTELQLEYPDEARNLTKVKIRRKFLKPAKDFSQQNGVPIVVTEFGCAHASGYPNNENRKQWTTDVIDLMEGFLDVYMWTYFTLDPHAPFLPSKPFLPCSGGQSQTWCSAEQAGLEDDTNEFSQLVRERVARP